MVQLSILSGRNAGVTEQLTHFPYLVGRSANCDLRLEEGGIWERHLQIDFDAAQSFHLTVLPGASALLNGNTVQGSVLRNGDRIQAGAVQLQFWFAPTRQSSLRWREMLIWLAFAILAVGQVLLVYVLVQ